MNMTGVNNFYFALRVINKATLLDDRYIDKKLKLRLDFYRDLA